MRKINMIFPAKIVNDHLSSKARKLASQLHEQKLLNAELLRICEHQRQLLTEQSGMIEEILEGIGR